MEKKQLSFDELVADADMQFADIETLRGVVKLGTVSSADILEWFDENEDKEKRTLSGLRLLVKCIVNPDGSRIGDDAKDADDKKLKREVAVQAMARRDSKENGQLVKAVLELNGLKVKKNDDVKNVSSETPSAASLTASGSKSVN